MSLFGFGGLRRRKIYPEPDGSSNTLEEPLIPLGDEDLRADGELSERQGDEASTSSGAANGWVAGALEWPLLLHSVAGACVDTFNNLCAVLSSCFSQWLPLLPQPLQLSQVQEQRLADLQQRISVAYNPEDRDHQMELRRLWGLAFPGEPFEALKCARWRDMGWQNDDPASDFRGGGLLSLQSLIYMGEKHPDTFAALRHKSDGQRSDWEYPFGAAGVNLVFMLSQLFDLRDAERLPASAHGRHFLALLEEDAHAFEEVFCAAFALLDRTWLGLRASYMEFPIVLKRTQERLEQVFSRPVSSLQGVRNALEA